MSWKKKKKKSQRFEGPSHSYILAGKNTPARGMCVLSGCSLPDCELAEDVVAPFSHSSSRGLCPCPRKGIRFRPLASVAVSPTSQDPESLGLRSDGPFVSPAAPPLKPTPGPCSALLLGLRIVGKGADLSLLPLLLPHRNKRTRKLWINWKK